MATQLARGVPLEPPVVEQIEKDTMRRVGRRLIPLLMVCYFAAYLDRVNVGFAALTMNKSLGFSAEIFGIGSGIFFVGYFLFEIPTTLRSAIIGILMTAIPISIVTGSLISGQILRLGSWGGLQDWQWLFILEAIPALALGIVVMFYLTDGPEQARCLRPT